MIEDKDENKRAVWRLSQSYEPIEFLDKLDVRVRGQK